MRNPAPRVLLVAVVVAAAVAGAGTPVAGDAVSTALSPSPEPGGNDRAATATPPATATPALALRSPSGAPVEQIDDEFDPDTETRIRIDLSPDRDARWEVSVRYALTDADERSAFETAADRFVAGEIGPDAATFEGFAREASRTVDRPMRIDDVDRDATVHEDPSSFDVAGDGAVAVGELRLTFVWTAFLAEDGENLVLGDALTTPNDGTWLLSLTEDQTIEVATPDGYSVTGTPGSTAARLASGDVVIEGPQLFDGEERVAVVYAPADTVGPPWEMFVAAILLGALLVAGGIVGYRRLGGDGTGEDERRPAAANGTDGAEPVDSTAGPDANPGGAADSDGGSATEEDLSLLSDEERVERLLDDSGGRMRQADIVAETGWSDAKVSQLLSAMAEAGRVEKLRLGRENLISLPDDEKAADGSDDGDDEGGTESEDESRRFG